MNNILVKASESITRTVKTSGLILKKHSPEILIGVGIVATVGAVVSAVVATKKVQPVIEEGKGDINRVKEMYGEREEVTDEIIKSENGVEYKKLSVYPAHEHYPRELTKAYLKCGAKITLRYIPTAVLTTTAIGAFLGAYGIVNRRNVALTAAYTAVNEAFNVYREAVKKELGDEKDHQFLQGLSETTVTNEDGSISTELVPVAPKNAEDYSQYSVFFDESNPNWRPSAEANKAFLRCQQNFANDILRVDGHLFLNKVYDLLGLPHTSAGALVGWVVGEGNENHVDFGIFDPSSKAARQFVNGYEPNILLDFNVDGIIYDLI